MICDVRKSKHQVDLAYIRQVEAGFQYPRTMMYGFFAKRTDPPSSSLLFWLAACLCLPASAFLPSPATFPDPLWSPIARSRNFWTGKSNAEDCAATWRKSFAKLFKLAGIEGTPHQFRHTLAKRMLVSGVPIALVSQVLGHRKTEVTQRHYNKWVPERQTK
jgi:Phage integrase family